MRTTLALSFVAIVACGAALFTFEQLSALRAHAVLNAGDAREAVARYGALITDRPVFLTETALAVRREMAAYRGLPGAIDDHDFLRARLFIDTILGGPTSGVEEDVRTYAASLPARHLDWATVRLEGGDAVDAVRQCSLIRELYASDRPFLERVRAFEGRSRLALTGQLLERGDMRQALEVLAVIDADAPLPIRAKAETLAREAVVRASDFYVERRDSSGLYRWLMQARDALRGRRYLTTQVEQVFVQYTTTLFDLPVSQLRMPESLDPRHRQSWRPALPPRQTMRR